MQGLGLQQAFLRMPRLSHACDWCVAGFELALIGEEVMGEQSLLRQQRIKGIGRDASVIR